MKMPDARAVKKAMLERKARFHKKFGRDPGPDDPVFLDPDADEPQEMEEHKIMAEAVLAMLHAGTPEPFIYSFIRTGGLIMFEGSRDHWPQESIDAWDQAMDEYGEIMRMKGE